MAFILSKLRDHANNVHHKEFVCDTESDIATATRQDGGVLIEVTDANGTTSALVEDGEKGDKGDTGEQGIQGEKGDPGKDGFTYKPVAGTVTTVDATQNAEVDIVTDEASQSATFNFRIPRGAVGQQGLTGKTGATGETGAAGKDGTTYTPEIGTVNTVEANNDAKATIDLDGDRAKFNFDIPKGVGIKSIDFTSSTLGDIAGIAGATDTYTITFTDNTKTTYEVFNGRDGDARIDDETTSETTVWSSQKVSSSYGSHIWYLYVDLMRARGGSALLGGVDNTKTVFDLLLPCEILYEWFSNTGNNNRFGIAESNGSFINYFQMIKHSDNSGTVLAAMSSGKVLSRRITPDGTVTPWTG